ncbi:LysR family transcriptional regulator [Amnibacterium sp. CER49]|uniref:LysR family transcriptional regulator n=1 Tax=Amnibacterium sp. CER49 TaxID=3039161 RepID=UPI00244CAD89|nr:LysR family transcriptional regulator [Amnibacterium sp. CER49]MDH2443176.1 LysR family transcriptional regulator [Amnibacterium sp. CER49]
MDVPITSLQYFCVLAEELHFGEAARRLRIASPTLSQQIARLESQLGARLLDRGPRRVVLTDAGRELLPLAREARRAHRAVLDWAEARRGGSGVLRVGVVAAGAGALTTGILAAALERIPGLRLEMRRLGFFDAPRELLAGTVDVAFTPAPLPPLPGIRAMEVLREGRVLVVAAAHPLAERPSVRIEETTDEVFVAPAGGDPAVLDAWLVDPRPDGRPVRRGPTADDIEGILELCAAGVGVNIAAASVATHYRRDQLAFVPIEDVAPASILLCSRDGGEDPVVRVFEQVALDTASAAVDTGARAT